jgi:type VI secretion system secreted protein VgrG
MADVEQWVNLTRDAKFVSDGISSIERVGEEVRFKCTFKNDELGSFRYKVVPVEEAKYSRKERGRNPHFKLRSGKGSTTNNAAGEVVIQNKVKLPAAGGNKYKIEVQWMDAGGSAITLSETIVTRRRLFYQSVTMAGVTAGDCGEMENEYWNPGKKYYLKLIPKGGGTIPLTPVLWSDGGTNNYIPFIQSTKGTYSLEPSRPFSFILVWSRYIASKAQVVVSDTQSISIPSKLFTWGYQGESVTIDTGFWLWSDLDPADDAAKAWLVNVVCSFTDAQGRVTQLNIPNDRVAITGTKRFAYGGYSKVKIDLSAADLQNLRNYVTKNVGDLSFDLTLRIAGGWTNGFSFNTINLITVAERVVWDDMSDAIKKYTLNHELGHKVGMTPDGTGRLPTKPSCYYTGQTHQGPHCSKGATFAAATQTWSGVPGCVMFGADGTYNGGVYSGAPPQYCGECEPLVRKLDLAATAQGFTNSVMDF